jgi:cysteine desulfurase
MKMIYMDHAATTPVHRCVFEAMAPYLKDKFGNPSSLYSIGREIKKDIEQARAEVAAFLGAEPEEIIFLSGGTEADNTAIKGVLFALRDKKDHFITCSIEHHAVLETAIFLENLGFKVTVLPVDSNGLVDPGDVEKAITDRTALVSIMHANNEIGTVQPVEEIGRIAQEKGVYFHTDAVQTFGHLPINVDDLNIDMLAVSAHKLYGPKGVGALYVRKGTKMTQFMHGGGQERHRRASTENVAGIIGLAKAVELAKVGLDEEITRLTSLRDRMIDGIIGTIEKVHVNGDREKRLPNNVNICFEAVEGESLLLALDGNGVEASSGSACSSGASEPSHVLTAIGLAPEIAFGSLRLTLGKGTTKEEVDYILEVLPKVISNLRAMSPVWSG